MLLLHALEMADGEGEPQPGDLIEIYRRHFQHWALYVGDGYVIHVTGISSTMSGKTGRVKKELLKDVAGKNKWRVNNKYDWFFTPLPVKDIIQHAERWVGKKVRYNVLTNNCEHFVTELRYGKRVSGQAASAVVGCYASVLTFAILL